MVAAPRDHEVGSCAALLSSWARLGTGKIMQVSHAFFRVFPVSFISGPILKLPLVRYSSPPRRRGPRRCARVAVAATDRGALLARGKLCRGPAIAAPWFNRTGDEPAARVVTSARTCSARVSPKLKR